MGIATYLLIVLTLTNLAILLGLSYQAYQTVRFAKIDTERMDYIVRAIDQTLQMSSTLATIHKAWETAQEMQKCQLCRTKDMLKKVTWHGRP